MEYTDHSELTKSVNISDQGDLKVSSSFRKELKGGGSLSINIEQVDNGWIVRMNKDCKVKDDWKYTSKEMIATEDPTEKIKSMFMATTNNMNFFTKLATELLDE